MTDLRYKLNSSNGGLKFILRILYPIILYTLLHLTVIRHNLIEPKLIQGLFILIWAALEWYFFLSVKKK